MCTAVASEPCLLISQVHPPVPQSLSLPAVDVSCLGREASAREQAFRFHPPTRPPKLRRRFCNLRCTCSDLRGVSSLALAAAAFDGCRAAPYVDAHCHLEGVLQTVHTRQTVPSLGKQWCELTQEEQYLWRILGWSRRQWESNWEPERENPIWRRPWASLSESERAAAIALSWDADKWEGCAWPLPTDVDWTDLTDEVRCHLTALGESSDSWADMFDGRNRTGAGDGGDGRTWVELTAEEKAAASKLGFSAATWDLLEMADLDSYLRDFCGSGFEACITQGCDGYSVPDAVRLALAHPQVFASFGCHPKNAWQYDDAFEACLLDSFSSCGAKAVAWGEFGLDYSLSHWSRLADYRQQQQDVFARQLDLAIARGLPLVLHIRGSAEGEPGDVEEDALRIMRRWVPRHWKAHVHGNHLPSLVKTLLSEWPNFFFGLTGTVTMGGDGEEMCHLVPLDRLLLETDGPFLCPRGTSFNHVGQIPFIARRIAEMGGSNAEKVLASARANTRFVYGI